MQIICQDLLIRTAPLQKRPELSFIFEITQIILTVQILSQSKNPWIEKAWKNHLRCHTQTTWDQVVTLWIWTETCSDKQFTLTSMMDQVNFSWIQLQREKVQICLTLQSKNFIPRWLILIRRWSKTQALLQKRSVQIQT